VTGEPWIEVDACPPSGLVVVGAAVRCFGVPDVLAGEVVAVDDLGAGFLGDFSDQGVAGGFVGLELSSGQGPEAVVELDEDDEAVGGEAEPVGLGDGIGWRVPAGGHQREGRWPGDVIDRLRCQRRVHRSARIDHSSIMDAVDPDAASP
jgi:hypothetical protein